MSRKGCEAAPKPGNTAPQPGPGLLAMRPLRARSRHKAAPTELASTESARTQAAPTKAIFTAAIVLGLISLAGCQTHLKPATYSADFQLQTNRGDLVPVECLKPAAEDVFDLGEDFVPLLPPGCANNLTLMRMVEQPADLTQGRMTGPTMAAPVGRAAQVYIEGYDRAELRRRQDEQQSRADSQERR